MEYSNSILSDVHQQQTDTNSIQQYQTSNKGWNSLVSSTSAMLGTNNTQGLVNEGFVTMPPQGTVTSSGNTNLSTMIGLQNASSLGQYAAKFPPGFGGENNGTSSNREFNNRTFNHVSDDVPVAIGYGRSNGTSMIPQSVRTEESLAYQQTQSLYGPSFGHSFFPTSSPQSNASTVWTPSTSFASQNLTNLQSAQTHALNNTGGYFPPQLQRANDQYSGYNDGMFGYNTQGTSTVNSMQGSGVTHYDSAHAKFDHGLGGLSDYYDPATPAGAVASSSSTHFPFGSFGNALQLQQSQQSQQQQQLQIQLLHQQKIHQQQHYQQLQIQKQQQQLRIQLWQQHQQIQQQQQQQIRQQNYGAEIIKNGIF